MSTTGIELKTRGRALSDAVELLSSMRFAISLLAIIAIAAMVGTVMPQNAPLPNYVDQFGPFWFEIFRHLGVYAIYSAWWFLLILVFLITSTALCIARNGPKMLRDMRSWREQVREESLRNFHHKSEWQSSLTADALAAQSMARLADAGYQAKLVDKGNGLLVAAKKGAFNKLGYIFAHSAIIIILLGGMLDSDLPIRFQQWFMGKTPFAGNGVIADIPAQHRLGLGNPTFRGNTELPEGSSSAFAIIPQATGVLVQELPFTLQLKKFHIDFYSTGMPKLFASDVIVHDNENGNTFPATIEVNKPLIYRGIAVYQSSFGDGGSKLTLTGFPMAGAESKSFPIKGEVSGATPLRHGNAQYSVEWSGFRPFNVENTASQDARSVKQGSSLSEQVAAGFDKHSGSAAKNANNKALKNVGPSVQYKLRDSTGQAREYLNYMTPVTIDGAEVYLSGVRASEAEPFRYLRIPADDEHGVRDWMRLRAALADPALRQRAAERYARVAVPPGASAEAQTLTAQLAESSARTLGIFAGDGNIGATANNRAGNGAASGGFVAVAQFIEGLKVPAAEQTKAANIFMKMLDGSLWQLLQVAREEAGLPALAPSEAHARFLQVAANALSDNVFYGAPVYLQLEDFVEVKSSVLQVTRSPGKKVVYLGCLLLVLGVFAMFYVRERRLWIWIARRGNGGGNGGSDGGSQALMAMSTQRKTLDFEREYQQMGTRLAQSA